MNPVLNWRYSNGIYEPKGEPRKRVPYERWMQKVELGYDFPEETFYLSISKWAMSYSLEIRQVSADGCEMIYSLNNAIPTMKLKNSGLQIPTYSK